MEDVGQISLPIDLEKEILEEDKIRLKEEENMVEALLFSLGRSVYGKGMRRGRRD